MTLGRAVPELVALLAIVIACAGVVLIAVAVTLSVAVTLALRKPRAGTYAITVPTGPAPSAELLFTHVHTLLRPSGWLSPLPEVAIAAAASSEGVRLVVSMPERYRSSLEASLDAIWPGAALIEADPPARPDATLRWHLIVVAARPASVITGAAPAFVRALTRTPADGAVSFCIGLRRERPRSSAISGLVRREPTRESRRPRAQASRDVVEPLFEASALISACAATPLRARTLVREFVPNIEVLCSGTGIQLHRPRRFAHGASVDARLAPSELAMLFPLTAIAGAVRRTAPARSAEGERLIGRRSAGRGDAEVRVSITASRQHLHVLGPTGTGKSTLLLNLIVQDIDAGRGCAVLDPKGDLVHELLSRIPKERSADVVYVGPEEGRRVVGINPLSLGLGEDPHLASENVLAIFKRIYEENWGPRTDDVLKSCLLTLVAVPGSTIAHIPALLGDPALRKRYMAHLDDEIGVGGFWRWYEKISEGKRQEVIAPLQNKLRDVLVRPRLRHLLCQPRSTVDLRALIDEGGILLVDLASGRWGESASALAGSFLIARLWQATLSRQAVPEDRRRDFLLYVDEFQSFLGIGGPFADALAQARGLRLSLTLANQHLGQLPREIREAVGANARNRVVFGCGAADVTALAAELPPLEPAVLLSLKPHEAAVRLVSSAEPVLVHTLPPALRRFDVARPQEILDASASRFGRDVATIDAELRETLRPTGSGESFAEKA